MYKITPVNTPNHVFNKNPNQGNTRIATIVYNGCLTKEYGSVVISSLVSLMFHYNALRRYNLLLVIAHHTYAKRTITRKDEELSIIL